MHPPHSPKCTKTSMRNATHHETDRKKTGKGSSPHSGRGTVGEPADAPIPKCGHAQPRDTQVASDVHVQANTQAHTKTGCADTFSQCDPF